MFFVFFLVIVLLSGPSPAAASDYDVCDQDTNLDLQIAGCSSVLSRLGLPTEIRSLAFANRGDAYKMKGDYRKAIADYSLAVEADPKNDSAFNNRGNGYSAIGDLDRAILDYDQAIKLDPNYAGALQ